MTSESEQTDQEAFHEIITYMKGLRQEIATHKKQIGELKEHCDKCDQSKKESHDALTGKYCRDCGQELTIAQIKDKKAPCPKCGCLHYSDTKRE